LVPDPAGIPPQTVRLANVANGLTLLRLLLVPVFAALLLHADGTDTGWRIAAWAVFAVASITDRVDGQLARSRGLVTEFGKLADPIADKALTGTALVGLSSLGLLEWWITVVILVREIGVTVLRFWVIRHGVIPASRGGKLKTLVQALAIGLYVLPLSGAASALAAWVMAAAVLLTLVTGADYVVRAVRLRRVGQRRGLAAAALLGLSGEAGTRTRASPGTPTPAPAPAAPGPPPPAPATPPDPAEP
jgi:CDP-diacylglycerol--glycerol-3-phosphate 3-phosphatidyltransferase